MSHDYLFGVPLPAASLLAGSGALCLLLLALLAWNRTLKKAVEKRTSVLLRAEESLQLTSFTVEHVADPVFWITADAAIIGTNEAACRLLGYSRDELLKLKIGDIDAHYKANLWPQHWEELRAHGSLFFETDQITRDGRIIPVEVTANFIRFNDREYNCAFIRNIADRKQAEEALREREERLRVIFEASDSGIILVNPEGMIEFANGRMAELFGMQLHELLGTPYSGHLHESETKVGDERMRMLINGEIQAVANERRFIRRNGTDFWGYLSGRRLENPDGSLRALVGVISDITDRKKAEEERLNLERQLLHAQKLESLGILSGGIAHDFNNLLLAVLGNLELALMRLPPEISARNNIDQAIKAARHAAKLTNMMLAYSGKGLFVIKPLNLTELVEENATMLDAAIPKSITLEQHLDHSLPIINADAGQVQQVIMNLITNAAEAIGDASGTITLETGAGEMDRDVLNESRLDEKMATGRYVWLEVRDNGCGMDSETVHKLFDPFFTTKFTGRGLGMSAVLGIIRAHKGAFLVKSVSGEGTTIKVLFPAADIQPTEPDPAGAGESVPEVRIGHSVKALVVDDEDMIRSVSTALLEELGFETMAAASGEEALAIFRRVGDIGVVLLDQVMPGMDGVSVFRELRSIRPDIKVLLASGFSQQEVSERFRGLGVNGFLQKPYNLKILTAELSRVLGRTDT